MFIMHLLIDCMIVSASCRMAVVAFWHHSVHPYSTSFSYTFLTPSHSSPATSYSLNLPTLRLGVWTSCITSIGCTTFLKGYSGFLPQSTCSQPQLGFTVHDELPLCHFFPWKNCSCSTLPLLQNLVQCLKPPSSIPFAVKQLLAHIVSFKEFLHIVYGTWKNNSPFLGKRLPNGEWRQLDRSRTQFLRLGSRFPNFLREMGVGQNISPRKKNNNASNPCGSC
jgi:hypothetical protein